jgi:hypothetical protein
MGTFTSNSNTKWNNADKAFGGLENTVADIGSSAMPENMNVDIPGINDQIEKFSILNALRSLRAEKETNPEVAAVRENLSKQINQDLSGGTPLEVQKELIKAGLGNVLATGVKTGSSAGNAILQNLFGRGVINYRDRQQQKAAGLLADNEKPIVGIDPSSAGNIMVDQNVANTNQRNQFLERNVARRDSRLADMFNRLQQSKQASAQQAQNNAGARNQTQAMAVNSAVQLASAALGAGGMAL